MQTSLNLFAPAIRTPDQWHIRTDRRRNRWSAHMS
jgi:hypothetical protein